MLLADKADRTPEEDKKLNALVRAEKAAFAAKTLGDAPRWEQRKSSGDALLAERGTKPKPVEPPFSSPA